MLSSVGSAPNEPCSNLIFRRPHNRDVISAEHLRMLALTSALMDPDAPSCSQPQCGTQGSSTAWRKVHKSLLCFAAKTLRLASAHLTLPFSALARTEPQAASLSFDSLRHRHASVPWTCRWDSRRRVDRLRFLPGCAAGSSPQCHHSRRNLRYRRGLRKSLRLPPLATRSRSL